MEITASLHFSHSSSFSLKPRFSDQSHLVFYGGSLSAHFRPVKTHLHTTMACSATSGLTALPPAQSIPSHPSSCNTVSCNAVTSSRSEPDLLQELATLKAQVKLKKKQLKAVAKEKKAALKGKKSKAKCESSSSSSETCDEGNTSVNMRLWKKGLPSVRDEEGSMQGLSGVDELHGSHEDVDQECVRQNPIESSSLFPSETTLNGFFFKSCTQSTLSTMNLAQRFQDDAAHAPCDAAVAAPTHGSCRAIGSTGSVEVCVGGKCKKAGSQQLLSSLRSQIPASASVEAMPCKCMGKCALAINVRVQKEDTNPQHHSHVGADDAGLILSHHFGLGRPPSGLPYLPSLASPTPAIHTAKV